ncbi:MAG: FAD-dependent oxidoreductase [Bacillota bacterium]
MKKVIVIGGNAGGLSAASQVKRQQPDWDVIVLEKGQHISYAACGIPYHVEGIVPDLDNLKGVSPDDARKKRKLDLRLNSEVTEIDPEQKTVTFKSEQGKNSADFDYLVIATGARPMQSGIRYSPSKRVYNAHTLEDSEAMRSFIEKEKPKSCAVVGGGYIAIEMLEAFLARGVETHLFHRRDSLSRSFEKEISDLVLAEMEKEGVKLHLNKAVKEVIDNNSSVEVYSEEEAASFDMVVVATGVEPNSDLARDAGIETGIKGSIKVNQYMQTNYPYIYSAGDCTETINIVSRQPVFIPLALKANKEGVAAGANISGGKEAFPGVLGSAITKFRDLGLARTGLTLAEAEKNGFKAVRFSVTAGSKSGYYPGVGPLTAVLIAEEETGRLLGAQLAGPVDGVKRIDVYATAITVKMSMEDIFQLDLAYAPPFSPVYDPVVLTGRVGRKKV